jgi:multiple sugar transport system substrate-binding protein
MRPIAAIAVVLLAAGCPRPATEADATNSLPFEGQTVRLLIVDDPELGTAIGRLAGEWKARTGADLVIRQAAESDLLASEPLETDAVIYPAWQLAILAERGAIAPLPNDILRGETLAWQEILPAVRDQETSWGGTIYAVPFGSPLLVCYFRQDLFDRFGKKPPQTWTDYQALAEFFHERENLADRASDDAAPEVAAPWSGTLEPLAEGWAGLTLLTRAAAYARHPDYGSTLFDQRSMAPLIARPPFVRALEELIAAQKLAGDGALDLDPQAVRAAFWRGECALALTWPSGGWKPEASAGERPPDVAGYVELPGATEIYNPGEQAWQTGSGDKVRHVPLLGVSGRLGSVARDSASQAAAFQLLVELTGEEWGPAVCGASRQTTCFRESHVRSPRAWVERQASALAAQQYAATIEQALARPEVLFALRIPGRERYLAALDAAVQRAISGERTPQEALEEAADSWRQITDDLGPDAQSQAYQRSLGQGP